MGKFLFDYESTNYGEAHFSTENQNAKVQIQPFVETNKVAY
jgi:hypothetical protein